MRKSLASFVALNRRAFLLLGILLSVTVFGIVTWRINAQSRSDNTTPGAIGGIPVFQAVPAKDTSSVAAPVSITSRDDNGEIDMAKLDMHPLSAPLAPRAPSDASSPNGAAIGTGKAYLGISHEIVNQNTTSAF